MSTLSQQAYTAIQEGIASGHLRPGSVVSEAELARSLGMSRTPVGEAIRKLAAEGLLEQVPRFGTIVRAIDRRDLVELFEVREALESHAASKAAERISPTEIAKLDVLCDAMRHIAQAVRSAGLSELKGNSLQEFLAADMAFHMLIVQASGNRRIGRIVTETRSVSRIFRMRRQRHDLVVVDRTCDEHERILDALRGARGNAARSAMVDHITASRDQAVAHLNEDGFESDSREELPVELPGALVRELGRLDQDVA